MRIYRTRDPADRVRLTLTPRVGRRRQRQAAPKLEKLPQLREGMADKLLAVVSVRRVDPALERDREDAHAGLGGESGRRIGHSAAPQRLGDRSSERGELDDLAFAQIGVRSDDRLALAGLGPALPDEDRGGGLEAPADSTSCPRSPW